MPAYYTFTTTVQSILDSVSRDVRQQLSNSATPDTTILIDYTNRVSLELLRFSKWQFLLSPPQRFITQVGVQNYWVGAAGSSPTNALDTALNLTDFRIIKPDTMKDRSNFRLLKRTAGEPLSSNFTYADSTARLGRPAEWLQDPANPATVILFPAPDNQNNYQPVPETPIVGVVAGGALPARTYRVCISYADSLGQESAHSMPTEIFLPAGFVLTIKPPQPPTNSALGLRYDRYNVYVGTDHTIGEFNRDVSICIQQPGGPFSTSTTFQEPNGGVVTSGPTPRSDSLIEPLSGYVIEFQYYRKRVQLSALGDIIQIPDDYRDVVVAGVAARAFKYLTRPTEYQDEMSHYRAGIQAIIRDSNFYSDQPDFIGPDPASVTLVYPTAESNDTF
jgi:hypothetical protein